MRRIEITPRNNFKQIIEGQGLIYHEGYYNENSAYELSMQEVNMIEAATSEIFDMYCALVSHVIKNELWDEFFIPRAYADVIAKSWNEDDVSFYGRFDLAYSNGSIKLLEFNADTPTSLIEASIIQWFWLKDCKPNMDQFNSLHEKLDAHIKVCIAGGYIQSPFVMACVDTPEDIMNVEYIRSILAENGIDTHFQFVSEIQVNDHGAFFDNKNRPIRNIFKLYPWEWLFNEAFGVHLPENYSKTVWIEPFYKAIMSNKMSLVYLKQLYPNSPYLLDCQYSKDGKSGMSNYVAKPVYSREGANTTVYDRGAVVEETAGDYGYEGYVCQEYFNIQKHQDASGKNWTPVIGSWVIGGVPAGMGIREQADRLITTNMSQFAPHYIKD